MTPEWIPFLREGGGVLAAIFVVSLLAWAALVRSWLELRAELARHREFARAKLPELRRRHGATAESAGGVVERLAALALASSRGSRRAYRQQMARLHAAELSDLERPLDWVAAAAFATPLLGLLGTVLGMMHTFAGIQPAGAVDFLDLSRGISEALITTEAGLLVAVPLVLLRRVLLAQVRRVSSASALVLHELEGVLFEDRDVPLGTP